MIPVVVTSDGECVQDITEIIDYFEQRCPEPSVYPAGAWQRLVSLLLEVYGDEWLVLPAMHYRWHLMFQRPLAHYQSLSVADKARIDPILDEPGGLGGLQEPVATSLKFEDYCLRLDRQSDTTAG